MFVKNANDFSQKEVEEIGFVCVNFEERYTDATIDAVNMASGSIRLGRW